MTDKISDFFKDIKDRLSSPFFSSFIIAWLIINWKVPVSLLWYNQAELEKTGYKSHFDLISNLYNPWFFIWSPILAAFAYTFLYPFFRNGVIVFNAWIKKWGTDISLKVSKEGKMPINEYLRIRQDYMTKTQALEETITNYQSQNNDLKNRIANLEDLNVSVSRDNKKFTEFNQIRALNGEWELTTEYQSNKTSNRISFAHGSIRIYDDISGKGTFTEYNYTFFAYNYFSKTLILGLQPAGGKELVHCVMNVKDNDTNVDLANLDGYFYRMSTVSPTNAYEYTSLKVSMRKLNNMASQN